MGSEDEVDLEERDKEVQEKIGKWNFKISGAEGLPSHSWERVANDEMWNAKVRYAMLAYENAQQAEAQKDLESAATNLVISYNLYKKAIETAGKDETGLPLAPAHWFKNCGLLHPKLLTIPGSPVVGSYEETVEMF